MNLSFVATKRGYPEPQSSERHIDLAIDVETTRRYTAEQSPPRGPVERRIRGEDCPHTRPAPGRTGGRLYGTSSAALVSPQRSTS
jgi:hypothetical protein